MGTCWALSLLFIVGCLRGAVSTTNITSSIVSKEPSSADQSGIAIIETNSTIPLYQRRTDDFYYGLETANPGYQPSPSPHSFNPASGTLPSPTHQDQVNYVSDILRNYNPGGSYGDPLGHFYGYQGQPSLGSSPSGSSQPPDTRQSETGPQTFNPNTFSQNFPSFPAYNFPPYGAPNFNPQPSPTQATESSGPGPTHSTNVNPVTNDIGYFNRFPPPTFPTYNFPDIEGITRNNTEGTFIPPQDFANFAPFGQQLPQGINPYTQGNLPPGDNQPNPENPNNRSPPPGFRYPNYGPGPQGFPPTQLGQDFPRGFPPPQQLYPNSNSQPTPTTNHTPQESGLAQPTNPPEQVNLNPNNPGQFEGYHPRYPYGPPATLPSFSPLRPGSEYGFAYNPNIGNDQGLRDSNGSSANARPFPGLIGYPVYANVAPQNTNYVQQSGPFYRGLPYPPPSGVPPDYQFSGPGAYQGYQIPDLDPAQGYRGQEGVQQPGPPEEYLTPPRLGPGLPYRQPGPGGPPEFQPPPGPGLRQQPQRSRGSASGPRNQAPPRLLDNYGDQQAPGTQGSGSIRELRRRPVGPGFPQSQGHFHYIPTPAPLEDTSPAPTILLTKLKRRGQVMALGGVNPKCAKATNATFCLEDPDYPRDLVKRALESSPSSLDLLYKDTFPSNAAPLSASSETFGARIFPSEDIRSPSSSRNLALDNEGKRTNNGDQGAPCPSSVHYARPLRALSAKGQWKVIVNLQDQKLEGDEVAEQVVRLDICSYPSTPCSFSGSSSASSPSRCLQKRKLHRLLSWSESHGLHQDAFYLPVACSCFVSN